MKINAAGFLAGLFAALVILGIVYSVGSSNGEAKVRAEWSAENDQRIEKIRELEAKNAELTTENARLTTKISKELEAHETAHKTALSEQRADYLNRLFHSEGRARVYREQAEGEQLERERLASHAAELDRALEEGRQLVRELRTTLGLRESQLRLLGEQILADRALLN